MPHPHQPGSSPGELPIDTLRIKQAALVLRALNTPLQRRLLETIYRNGQVCISRLCIELDLEQDVTSVYLAELCEAGLVQVTKEGHSCLYSINHQRLKCIQFLLKGLRHTEL